MDTKQVSSTSSSMLDVLKKPQTWGILLSVSGLFIASISLFVQYQNMDHGTSGQLTIDSNMNTTIWPIALSFVLLFIGGMLYIFFDSTQKPFLWLFAFGFLSLVLSNFALLMSLYQVQITKV
jgi:hypothetical protein